MGISKQNRGKQKESLTVSGRWGFLLLILLLAAACSSSSKKNTYVDPGSFAYSAKGDSLSLTAFESLPVAEQISRRIQADQWLQRLSTENNPSSKIRFLGNANGLAPDNPTTWLQQAHLWRWLGDYLKTVECLESAAEAVRHFNADVHSWSKKEMQRQTALARAWLHYDRGQWQQGLDWAKVARQISPTDSSVRQIYALLAGHSGMRSESRAIADELARVDESHSDIGWIEASYWVSRMQYRQAFNYIMELRPNSGHQAECWREMGEIAEFLEEYSWADRWYEESLHTLPISSSNCLARVRHSRLKPGGRGTWQKVWLAYDRYYVTGSHSAYAGLALERFEKAKDGIIKGFWAGQVVNSTGVLLRKEIDKPWAFRARGLVFASMENSDRAIRDLKQSAALLAKMGHRDSKVESTLGHLLLQKENHEQALKHLERALELDSNSASIWQDYGLALIMSDQDGKAEAALTRALELDSGSATSWYNRGLLHLHRKDFGRAVSDLEKAAGLASDNAEVIQLLQKAKLLERQNR